MSFAHLHLHTEYSMLDGAARIDEVVELAARDGQPGMGITDHGVLYGVVDFVKATTSRGLKPVVGIEAYFTDGSRFERPTGSANERFHLLLYAENQVGYRNLMKLSSRAFLEGYYYKPRMDFELLAEHSEGIIATSGCLGGLVPQLLGPDFGTEENSKARARDFDAALAAAGKFQDIFGRDNFFIELQDHGIEAQRRIMPDLLEIGRRIDAPLLATNDAHYATADQAAAHDVLLCIQTGSLQSEENRFKFSGGDDYYVKSAQQMQTLFPQSDFPDACDNTLWIVERSNVAFEFGKILLPQFPVPSGHTELSYLEELVYEGAKRRYGDPLGDDVRERIQHELKIIDEMGFNAYFLIVWDLIRFAREQRIRVGPGRGSAAGSIISYCLGITALDPIKYRLIFERFLNPGRREMPDIDMDFDERYRADVIRYAAETYGSDHVAQIVTFSTIKGKQAIRDAARVLGHPYGLGDKVAKAMPPAILGKEATLDQVLAPPDTDADGELKDWYANAAELRTMYEGDPAVRDVVEAARGLEGLRRQDSIHAAAVVITPEPLMDLVPIQQKGEGAEVVTQYEMGAVEALGLLKMDFLGLRNLSIIERTLELIEERSGERVDIDNVDLEDEPTFELLRRADTIGVFQLEGSAMRSLIRSLQPDTFEDVVAINALYRPGPMGANMHYLYADRKNGRKPVEPLHEAIVPLLKDTYQIIVYQEQVMQVAQEMAGYSMAEADKLRKAMGKKIKSVMDAEKAKFVAGCITTGYEEKVGSDLFDLIAHFSGYGFNRSHSAAYGLITFQTAYLKAHYPAESMAALLTATKKDKDRTAIYLNECRQMGIDVLVPDINESHMDFTVNEAGIRFGLSAVRNVGESVVERILASRHDGPFEDFQDFIDRVDPIALNKRTIESLVKAGGFDGVGHPRKGLFLVYEGMLDATLERRRNEDMGQFSLFAGAEEQTGPGTVPIPVGEWKQKTKLAFEKEMLGLYISDHPLLGVRTALSAVASTSISDLMELKDRAQITLGGLVGGITRRWTRKGDPMIFFQLEDLEGSVEAVCFPRTVQEAGHHVVEDAIVIVSGTLDHRGDDVKVIVREIREMEIRDDSLVRLQVPATRLSPDVVKRLKSVLSNHPGQSQVLLQMTTDEGHKVLKLSDQHRVEPRSALFAELKELLGQKAVL